MKAIWSGKVIAESNDTVVVGGNHYFPPQSVKMEYLTKTPEQYVWHWKGTCDYYSINVDGNINPDGAWMYPEPTAPAKQIQGRFAFWHGVTMQE